MEWSRYHRLDDIQGYMHYLEHKYPHLAQVIDIGKSVEGRHMLLLKIGSRKYTDKPAIFIEAGNYYSFCA